jgi:hypothetical protein
VKTDDEELNNVVTLEDAEETATSLTVNTVLMSKTAKGKRFSVGEAR